MLSALLAAIWVARRPFILRAWRCRRRSRGPFYSSPVMKPYCPASAIAPQIQFPRRPASWLAIRGRQLWVVQDALGLHNPRPCTWKEAFSGRRKLFIAPPVNGWILVIGSGFPQPADDVDACFRCLLELSRKLGHVQFFSAVRGVDYHAWAQAEAGRVVRAYAWAGRTLWNQGVKTRAELELGLKCFQYLESPQGPFHCRPNVLTSNTERVPALAARWSLDPAAVQESLLEQPCGVAGEPTPLY
jgi:hypothetical protein